VKLDIGRGRVHATILVCRGLEELGNAIHRFLDDTNTNPKPFTPPPSNEGTKCNGLRAGSGRDGCSESKFTGRHPRRTSSKLWLSDLMREVCSAKWIIDGNTLDLAPMAHFL
jgi:hypothetical protein